MEFNSILFPAPKFNLDIANDYDGELIFIPKKGYNLNDKKETKQFIPCIFLISTQKKICDKLLIFFHGNAEDIFLARDFGEKLKDNLNMNILLVEYPTYSIYTYENDTNLILENSLDIFDFLTNKLNILKENIFVFGRSIGTAPAIFLASKRKIGALISVSAFTSIRNAAQNLVGGFLKYFISDRFNSIEYIKKVTCPIMFIHGRKDTLISFQHSLQLKDNCNCPYEILLPEEMTHNKFDYFNDLIIPIKAFLDKHTGFNKNLRSHVIIPNGLFNMPLFIKENIKEFKEKNKKKGVSCLFINSDC